MVQKTKNKFTSNKYWTWFALFMLVEVISFIFLVNNHRINSINQQKKESLHSARFLSDIIKINLQENNYSQIELFINSWYKSHEDYLGDLTLSAKNGFVVVEIHSKHLKRKHTFKINKDIEYSYNKVMKLQLVIDLDKTFHHAQEFAINLFLILFFTSIALGYMIFLVGKKNASSVNLNHRQEELDDLLQELVQEVERRKQSESNLISNQTLLQQAQEIALIGSWELDYETGEIVGSPEFFNIIKLPYKNNGNISLKEILKVTLDYNKIIRESNKSKEIVSFDEECYVVDQFTKKITKTVRVIGRSMIDKDTSKKVIRGVMQDITEKKKIEIESESANTDLKEMLHIVAHELQTPLVTMEGFSSLILDNFKETMDEKSIYYIERINDNALGMKKLINSILDISRLNTIIYPSEKFSTIKMLNDLKKEIEIMSDSKVFISINTFPEIPEIYGDKQRIYLVFRNLLLNAINYGGENLEIGYLPNKGFFVKDDGIGIKIDYIERIFMPGERLKETEAEGTGMGLTFCKKILDLHRGRIWAESEGKGKGSTFYFYIPMSKED
ncbi:MAG: hypothetical protein GQ534_03205 [Candidatus Delongbacteria bacterium]|nr:hypothetical protein [Candidatus Delongbacteria bacterium]